MGNTKLPIGELCYRCRENKEIIKKAERRERIKGKWTKKYICRNCYDNDCSKERYLCDRRMGNLNPNSNQAFGDNCEELTCRWRGVKNLNIENDNYRSPIDHSMDLELGIIQTRGRSFDRFVGSYGGWGFSHIENIKKFDNLICYCINKDGKIIERIYIFPWKEISNKGISIVKTPSRGIPWYEKYRIKDEDTLKRTNNIWKQIIEGR